MTNTHIANATESKKLHENLIYIFAQANQNIHLRLQKRLKSEGVQVSHWRILETLSDQKGRSMGDLAGVVLMNHPTLTKMLDRMVLQNLVSRKTDSNDNRRVLVMITEQGLELFTRLHIHGIECHNEIEQYLGVDEWGQLKNILHRIIDQK